MAWTTPGTATAGSVLTAAFLNTNLRDNMIELAPFAAAWTTYAPTWSGITVGNGVTDAKYVKVGKHVSFYAKFTLGSTSAVTGQITVTVPTATKVQSSGVFNGVFVDSGVGFSPILIYPASVTELYCYGIGTTASYAGAAATNGSIPFTWSVNDAIWVGGVYEAA